MFLYYQNEQVALKTDKFQEQVDNTANPRWKPLGRSWRNRKKKQMGKIEINLFGTSKQKQEREEKLRNLASKVLWSGWICTWVDTSGKLQILLELRFEALEVMGKVIIPLIYFELIFKVSAQEKKHCSIRNFKISHVGYFLAAPLKAPVISSVIFKTVEIHGISQRCTKRQDFL